MCGSFLCLRLAARRTRGSGLLAAELGVSEVMVTATPGVLSALGGLVANIRTTSSQQCSWIVDADNLKILALHPPANLRLTPFAG